MRRIRNRARVLRRTAMLAAIGALALFGAAPEAHALTTVINQCNMTVVTNAVLIQDLICPDDGIVVGADGITIDLKGFTLRGDRGALDSGISNLTGFDKVTIKNGVVRNFGVGVHMNNRADLTTISNVVASGNVVDGVFVTGDGASIKSTFGIGSGITGIYVVGDDASIASAVAADNPTDGIYVDGDSATVKSSTASGNFNNGISIIGGSASVKGSTLTGNAVDGLRILGNGAVLKGNTAVGNGFASGNSDLAGLGINVTDFPQTPPAGLNTGRGNDSPYECFPDYLC